jgi:predicted RNA-binding protein Jag
MTPSVPGFVEGFRNSCPDKQRERGGIAVQKIAIAHRAYLTVAEEARQAQRSEVLLNQSGVVTGPAKQMSAPSVATTQAAAEKVRRWGDIVELEPLSAFDRRVIHQALKDDPGIETHSVEVEGTDKKAILLRPKR